MESAFDWRINHKSSLVCVGPSQSGKTTFVHKLLKYRHSDDIFTHKLGTVHWHYGTYFDELSYYRDSDGYKLYEGLPNTLDHVQPFDVIVLDDLMVEAGQSKLVTELFTRIVHHRPCFLIMLVQNHYYQTKDAKTRQINTKYNIFFKNPRDKGQILILGRQIFPEKAKFLKDVFDDATKSFYGYLFVDFHQDTPDNCRLRARILPEEAPQYVYEQ